MTSLNVQAEEPTISYSLKMEINYTGELYQSTDGVTWTKVEGASNPYYVSVDDYKKLFFCSRLEIESKDITIPLSDMVNLDMIWIEPGTFMMGQPDDPYINFLHQVTLTQGYWLGKYEVTQAQYESLMEENPSFNKGADLPVEKVTWNDAKAFCTKLTEIEKAAGRLPEGYEYTLPTEAQWEYACRAGTTTDLNNGKDVTTSFEESPEMDEVGWYKYNSNLKTQSVGQKQPNTWGLYDMHGNVSEWCQDWYGTYPKTPEGLPMSVTDPVGPDTGEDRVIRSGSCSSNVYYCRSFSRDKDYPKGYSYTTGFRVALAPVK